MAGTVLLSRFHSGEFFTVGGSPLVVLGESGSGKSALLANWAMQHRAAHPDDLVLMHLIGAGPYSADWAIMLRRIMGEFQRHFDIQRELPDRPEKLRLSLDAWLNTPAPKGRVVLILDALDQVAGRLATTSAQVAIAWLLARPSITAPIASATNLDQLRDLIEAVNLKLDQASLEQLNAASAFEAVAAQ